VSLDAARGEIESQVGQVRRTAIEPIPVVWARRFALACGETDPVWFDDDAARAAGYAAPPLPPLLLTSTRSWEAGPVALNPDGTPQDDPGFPAGHGLRALGGGQRLAFDGDAVTGVPLTAEVEVLGVEQKSGRSGDLLIVELERRFTDVDGRMLVRCAESRVLR
jgi:hypothetical protein